MNHQEVQQIREQFRSGQWPQFLEMVEINGLRGFTGQEITFDYPITAIVGENGSGKSTVLKAAACAYENTAPSGTYFPSTFFIDTHWETIKDVTLRFRIKQGPHVHTFQMRKPTKRWSYPHDRYRRSVYILDISRTLPLDATAGYAKIAKQAAGEVAAAVLEDDFVKTLSYVLSRDYKEARFVTPDIDRQKEVGVLRRDFGEVSQFHQGAGEDATLDLFKVLQQIPDYSLLLIDEVEASLHPKAQRRLIHFLLRLCRTKRLQIILSTHSPYVLDELPLEARVLLLPGRDGLEVIYGSSTEFALTRLDDRVHPELTIFVEDKVAEVVLREIIASHQNGGDVLQRIQITPVGPENVVQLLGRLAVQGKLPYRSMAVVDGDVAPSEGTIALPGSEPPEVVVYKSLRDAEWPELPERFGIGAGDLFDYLEEAMREADFHRWNAYVGDRVRKSASSVWETLATTWARHCLADGDRDRIMKEIEERSALK